MIVYTNNKVYTIDDSRIRLRPLVAIDDNEGVVQTYKVIVDGFYFTTAVGVYLENQQYQTFNELKDKIDFKRLFPKYDSIIFCNLGVSEYGSKWKDNLTAGGVSFKDYTEKGREGISYFRDVITESDKRGDFKRSYVCMEVRV